MVENWQTAGFGLYVHWPFCAAKCPYCDFNSHVRSAVDQQAWANALCQEIRRSADLTGRRVLNTVYFGGGTPSLMAADTVDAILKTAQSVWDFSNEIEITLEANPTSVEADRLAAFRDVGVNRVSLGLQALSDPDLKALGRLHSVDEGRRALNIAQKTFDRVSFDLMYGRQEQTVEQWDAELRQALTFGTDHLSLYQLTVEPETVFGERYARGLLRGLPDEDRSVELWNTTQSLCGSAGLDPYEISNFARNGQESRHNLIYWRSGDWVGVGPGAHGRLTLPQGRMALETALAPEAWIERVLTSGSGETSSEVLTNVAVFEERVMMGLRMAEGVELPQNELISFRNKINGLEVNALVCVEQGRLKVTDEGRPLLNAILSTLL